MTKCPQCGYSEQQFNKQPSNIMNIYQNEKDPNDKVAVNSNDKKITTKEGKVYVRVDSEKAMQDLIKQQQTDPELTKAPEMKKEFPKSEEKPKQEAPKSQVEKAPILPATAPVAATEPAVELPKANPFAPKQP